MVQKIGPLGLLWLLPLLAVVLLLSSSFWMWKEVQDLSYDLLRSESNSAAEQIQTRLELFLFERGKDLSHLASLKKNELSSQFIERFIKDAHGIVSREKSYYAISYLNATGAIVARSGLDTVSDSLIPLKKLNLSDYLKKMATDSSLTLVSLPITSSNGERLLVFFKPVFIISNREAIFDGVIAATIRERQIISNIIMDPILKSNQIKITISDTLLFDNSKLLNKSIQEFTAQAKAVSTINSMGRIWTIMVYPPMSGLLQKLIKQNNFRFILNGVASIITASLLALALFISDRLRVAKDKLARSEERYRRLAENASDMIFQQSIHDGHYEYVSPAAERITGFKPQDYYDTPFLFQKILVTENQDYYNVQWQQILKGETPHAAEFCILNKSGERRWINQRNSLVYNNGVLVAVEGIITDITDQKKASNEREKLIKELESKNRDLERFTYTISHELKTPLITIKGFLGYLEDEAVKGDFSRLHQDVLRIVGAAETMSSLLDNLIVLNRIGQKKSSKENIDLYALVQNCVSMFSDKIKRRSIVVFIHNNLPIVNGFPDELMVLYRNLIDNAIKFSTDQPEPTIEIGLNKTLPEGYVLYLKDNGAGFENKYKERIFGLFNKLDSTTEGTGAGLALVKRIVEHHNGWIYAESEGIGKGTTIYFMLPTE